jgi:hypothetical protein
MRSSTAASCSTPRNDRRFQAEASARLRGPAGDAVLDDGGAAEEFVRFVGPDGEIRLQWCAGAPGIVIAAAPYLEEDLLLAGAELVWQAGAHGEEKGPSICHGTAGNGYALLRTFELTGDERWLERARRFAMHALEQVERRDNRYALWTGDVGVALFASDCLDARARYPILETWA